MTGLIIVEIGTAQCKDGGSSGIFPLFIEIGVLDEL